MERIKFRTISGDRCNGYLLTWEGLSLGLTKDQIGSIGQGWSVIELQTGYSIITKPLPTRKRATEEALELLNSKGVRTVKERIKEVLVARGNTKIKGRIQTTHCTSPGNRLKSLCGRTNGEYSLPLEYFKYAKKPCKKCWQLARKKPRRKHTA